MKQLLAIGNCMGAPEYFKDLFSKTYIINSVDEALKYMNPHTMVMYGGGEDISPSLYNEPVNDKTGAWETPSRRDKLEKSIFEIAKEAGAKHFGICRGSQFLAAMAGGKLFQHVNNHGRNHTVEFHVNNVLYSQLSYGLLREERIELAQYEPTFLVTSTHHQAVDIRSLKNASLLFSTPCISDVYETGTEVIPPEEIKQDTEAYYLPEEQILGIQGHPEFMNKDSAFVKTSRKLVLALLRS
jgi:gamma-glutamyl-gamma-aminobutyrate hydrolase PuuD